MRDVRVSLVADRDIGSILDWSLNQFGPGAGERYRALIDAALADIAADAESESDGVMSFAATSEHITWRVAGIAWQARWVRFVVLDISSYSACSTQLLFSSCVSFMRPC
jgi:plasmid stabilization system protein ParE